MTHEPPRPDRRGRRLSTPAVLAACSAMVSVGVAAYWIAAPAVEDDERAGSRVAPQVDLELGTPDGTAETFLDAWRKRDHELAALLAVDEAQAAVKTRARDEADLGDEARAAAALWGVLAKERLRFVADQIEALEDLPSSERLRLVGVAEGTFFQSPYKRRVTFVVRRVDEPPSPEAARRGVDGRWRVEAMTLGEQLVAPPELRKLEGMDP